MLKKSVSVINKLALAFVVVLSLVISTPTHTVHANNSAPANSVRAVEPISIQNIESTVAPNVTNAEMHGKIERGGSQIYALLETVVLYATYIGFLVGVLWIIVGFGRSGRVGGAWLMFLSSLAYLLLSYGPEAVTFLSSWFQNL